MRASVSKRYFFKKQTCTIFLPELMSYSHIFLLPPPTGGRLGEQMSGGTVTDRSNQLRMQHILSFQHSDHISLLMKTVWISFLA